MWTVSSSINPGLSNCFPMFALASEITRTHFVLGEDAVNRGLDICIRYGYSGRYMAYEQGAVEKLYGKLLRLYPRAFRERLGESMQQTFADLYREQRRRSESGVARLMLWIFLDTAIGICRERLLLVREGVVMQALTRNLIPSALLSLLLILPLMIMEVVNRRRFNEEFPFLLFFGMWINLLTISLILLPIVLSRWNGKPTMTSPVAAKGNTLLTNPISAALLSAAIIAGFIGLGVLDRMGVVPLQAWLNGPNPEVAFLPGQIIAFSFFVIPLSAGVIAAGPIASTLRAGGGLFAHPFNLIIVALVSAAIVMGLVALLIDQWPCFIGVPNCD